MNKSRAPSSTFYGDLNLEICKIQDIVFKPKWSAATKDLIIYGNNIS